MVAVSFCGGVLLGFCFLEGGTLGVLYLISSVPLVLFCLLIIYIFLPSKKKWWLFHLRLGFD